VPEALTPGVAIVTVAGMLLEFVGVGYLIRRRMRAVCRARGAR
jgi:hypothetical protein